MTAIKVRVRNRSPALSTTPQESPPARARVRFFIAKIYSPFCLNASGDIPVGRNFRKLILSRPESALFTRRKFDVAPDAKPTFSLFPAKAVEDSTSDGTVSSLLTPSGDIGQLNNEKRIRLNSKANDCAPERERYHRVQSPKLDSSRDSTMCWKIAASWHFILHLSPIF